MLEGKAAELLCPSFLGRGRAVRTSDVGGPTRATPALSGAFLPARPVDLNAPLL